jgi:hypothetical protein
VFLEERILHLPEENLLAVRKRCGFSMAVLPLILHVGSENVSPQPGLDGVCLWFGLLGYRTSQHWTFLWSYMKILFYFSPVNSDDNLIALIVEAAATFRHDPGIFERTCRFLMCCCRLLLRAMAIRLNICITSVQNKSF